ncbi:MAG TPA: hypothetical protein VES70_15415 [Pseudomonas sp.]|nr:hypothetical protein [Pseudomonas sp.]
MANSKMIQQCVFMTSLDEREFAGALLAARPSVRFIDMLQQPDTNQPKYRCRIDECGGAHVTIVDSSIVSEDYFHKNYVRDHPSGRGWIYALVGSGLVSLLRSRAADFLQGSILNGELRASIPTGDEASEVFVAIVLREAKARGGKVVSIDTSTGERGTKADRKFIVWPDAAQRFDGTNGAYLANGVHAVFVPKASGI